MRRAGYGHISPVTVGGRIFTMVITIFGLPLMVLSVGSLGKLTAHLSLMFFSIFGTVNRDEKRLRGAIARMVRASDAAHEQHDDHDAGHDAAGLQLPSASRSSHPQHTGAGAGAAAAEEQETGSAVRVRLGRRRSIWQQAQNGRSSPIMSKHAAMGDTEEFKNEGGMWQYFGVLCVVFVLFLVALAILFCPIGRPFSAPSFSPHSTVAGHYSSVV